MIEQYVAPFSERALLKGVPMMYRRDPLILKLLSEGARIKYRGPRIGTYNYHTLMRDATGFSVYLK